MNYKNIIVCAEIKNSSWRWISHHFPDSVNWYFYHARNSGSRLPSMVFRLWAGLNAVIKGRHADVIVSHGPYMAFYCALFIWLLRVKTAHVVYSFNFAVLPTGMALKRMRLFFKKIDCLVVSSTMERSLYAEHFDIPIEKIDFVRWGVAEPNFDLKPSMIDKPYISTVGGNARDYKTFMAMMAELPEIQAIAVMRPHNLEGLDVPSNVKVLLNIPKDDALSVITNSVCTVLPLTGSEIPCGHVTIVVAMYLGIPCVVTNSSGVNDYVIQEETGLLCDPTSVVSMKESINRLISDKRLSSKLAESAEAFVRESCGEKNYVSHFEGFVKRVSIDVSMENKPNLFLVGAMKSATTSLHNYLDVHSDIFMSKDPWKEPNYFVKKINYKKGIEWYLSLFEGVENKRFIGESSTDYTKSPHYADVYRKIYEFSPNAKILYIMRDPIERAISQYWWEVEYSGEGRDMKQGILQNEWIMNTGYYAKQIKPYIDLFGRDNVYTLTTEELMNDPNEAMKNIFSWLEISIDVEFKKENLKVHNKSSATVNRLVGSGVISRLKGGLFWRLLKKIIKAKYRGQLLKLFSRKVEKNSAGRKDTIDALRPIMLAQTQELSELLGRDFPEWEVLYEENND